MLAALRSIPSRQRRAAFLTSLAAAFSLGGYEMIRSASNSLFKQAFGTHRLPLVMAALPVVLALTLWVYGRLISRVGPRRTLLSTTLGSAFLMVVSYLFIRAGYSAFIVVAFLLRDVYIVLLIEQYWSFLDSTLESDSARVLNGPVAGLASVGSILGGLALGALAVRQGTAAMLLWAAAWTVPAALISDLSYRKTGEPTPKPTADHSGVKTLVRSRFLTLFFLVLVSTQVIATMLDLRFQEILHEAIPDIDSQTAFSGRYFALLNGAAMVLQFVAAPLLLRFVPLPAVHVLIPAVHLVLIGAVINSPSLATAGAAFLVFKAVDYSVFRAAKEVFFIPLPFDVRYRSKEVIDVFGYRSARGLSALAVSGAKSFAGTGFIAMAVAAVWASLVVPMTRAWRKEAAPNANS